MIYLKASVPLLKERIAGRGREFELNIRSDYLAQLNELYEEFRNPPVRVKVTAAADPSALSGLIDPRSPLVSMILQIRGIVSDFKNPSQFKATAEPVETGVSGAITTLANADGFVDIAANQQFIEANEEIKVTLLNR